MRPDIHRERPGGLCPTGEVGNQFESLLQSALRQPPSDPPPVRHRIHQPLRNQSLNLRKTCDSDSDAAAARRPVSPRCSPAATKKISPRRHEDAKNRKGFLRVFAVNTMPELPRERTTIHSQLVGQSEIKSAT